MVDLALVSPSGTHAAMFPTRRDAAIADLTRLGFSVSTPGLDSDSPDTALTRLSHDETAQIRVLELEKAFTRSGADIVMATIGGLTAIDLVGRLDFSLLAESNLPLCGY
ncbi:MAG: LD-carboxypeptidase, partial [Angustibacter sp.]